MRYISAILLAILTVALLVCNTQRLVAKRRVAALQEYYDTSSREIGYQMGLADGVNATMACVKISGTNKPKLDLAQVLDYARTNKSKSR